MKKTVTLDGKNITVDLEEFVIRIYNDDDLQALLAHNTEAITGELIKNIKAEFYKLNKKEFEIPAASIAVEIWGHVYADKFFEAVKSFSSIGVIDKLAEKFLVHCERIDIGEQGHDDNRFVWDMLAPFKSAIAKLLPGK